MDTKDYKIYDESIEVIILLILLIPGVVGVVCYVISGKEMGRTLGMMLFGVACGVLPVVVGSLYYYRLHQKRKRMMAEGYPHKGKIYSYTEKWPVRYIRTTPISKVLYLLGKAGRTDGIYTLQIQIVVKGKRQMIETKEFREHPNKVLTSNRCTVFEKDGVFYPANFSYDPSKKTTKVKIPTEIEALRK